MIRDLCLEKGDKVGLNYAKNARGSPILHVYVEKNQSKLVTPMGQSAIPVPVGDTTLNGAKPPKSAVAAAMAAGASPSGTGKKKIPVPAGTKTIFHGKEKSERRDSENPQLNQKRHQVEEPALVAAPPPPPKRRQVEDPAPAVAVNALFVNAAPPPPPVVPTPTPSPTAAAIGTGFLNSRVNLGLNRRKLMLDLLKRHNVPKPTIEAFGKMFFVISEEDWECIYEDLIASDDAIDSGVQKSAEDWVRNLAHLQNMQSQ